MASSSKATQQYLTNFKEDAKKPLFVLAHHFLQYNAVLAGGAYIGDMVSQKLCVPHGAPGVRFYAFDGVPKGKGAAEVQRYMRDFDTVDMKDDDRQQMLNVMHRVYDDVENIMQECYEINPQVGKAYGSAKDGDDTLAPPAKIPDEELIHLTLPELRTYTGEDGGRIIMSLNGELLDVSAGREMYGPGGSYALLAAHDVTRCLATMSLETELLDDLDWKATTDEDKEVLQNWCEKLKAKYPVAGTLRRDKAAEVKVPTPQSLGLIGPPEGLRQRKDAPASSVPVAPAASAPAADDAAADQRCPISGKEGVGCPMSMFMGGAAKPKPKAAPKSEAAKTGFMKGKSIIAAVNESKAEGESFIYKLCPLHWDENTTRLLITVTAAAWVSGIFVGWNLHRLWSSSASS